MNQTQKTYLVAAAMAEFSTRPGLSNAEIVALRRGADELLESVGFDVNDLPDNPIGVTAVLLAASRVEAA